MQSPSASRKTAMRFVSNEDGTVAVILAVTLIGMLGVVGLAVDYSRFYSLKTKMQAALDSAVLAGASAVSADPITRATDSFNSNQAIVSAATVTPVFTKTGNRIDGQASTNLKTSFLKIIGISEAKIQVSAAARNRPAAQVCVLILDQFAPQAFLVNSGANVTASSCQIDVKSTANPAAIFNSGSNISAAKTCIESTSIIDNGGTHPNLETNCRTVSDPFRNTLPSPVSTACAHNNLNFNGGNVTLNPGVYCSGINFNAAPNVSFSPGLYVIKGGDWNVNGGNWTGNGVTFYFEDSSRIQFNSAVAATLTAPVSGTYQDIIMYEANGLLQSPLVFDDSRNFEMRGLVYLPSRDVTFNSGSQARSKQLTLVVNTLILNQTVWNLEAAAKTISSSSTGSSFLLK